MQYRVGQGLDIHRLDFGRKLILAGVELPFEKGLVGHSDADVVAHAVIDALLGACGLPDIGVHFPPSEAQWKDANSLELLQLIFDKVSALGWKIENIDCCITAEAPKIAPFRDQMISNLASVLQLTTDAVNVKAGTFEKLGALGRGEGIMANAVVLMSRA